MAVKLTFRSATALVDISVASTLFNAAIKPTSVGFCCMTEDLFALFQKMCHLTGVLLHISQVD